MNSNIQKLKDANDKDRERMAQIQARIEERDKKIEEMENEEILSAYRETQLPPDKFVALIKKIQAEFPPDEEETSEAP